MADLKERVYAEALVQLRAQTTERLVGKEDGALDFGSNVVNGARVTKTERCPPLLKGVVCVEQSVEDSICPLWRSACDVEGREDGEGVDGDGLLLVHQYWDGGHRSGMEWDVCCAVL